MKKLLLSALILLATMSAFAAENPVDSLANQINKFTTDQQKAQIYTQMANSYMDYAAIQDKELKTTYQEKALKYTFSAIHAYSRLEDSTALRICFDRLAKIYRDQKKYSPAKWYILQSNTMARNQNDLSNITESLITLAGIKMDIKDYDLAKRDLHEALELSSANRFSLQQANVMLAYTRLWKNLGRPQFANESYERYEFIKDSMKNDSESHVAKVIVKKKLPITTARLVKNNIQKSTPVYSQL